MRYVEVGGVRLSAVGLGPWQFGSREWGYGSAYAEHDALDIVARITKALAWPDGGQAPFGEVVLLSTEDNLEHTVVPFVNAQGGDPSQVTVIDGTRKRATA